MSNFNNYQFQALTAPQQYNTSRVYGVNSRGDAVGNFDTVDHSGRVTSTPCIWPAGQPQTPIVLPVTDFVWDFGPTRIADSGDAAGFYQYVVNGAMHIADLYKELGMDEIRVYDICPPFVVGAIGNPSTLRGFILNYKSNVLTWLNPFPQSTGLFPIGIAATGINSGGET